MDQVAGRRETGLRWILSVMCLGITSVCKYCIAYSCTDMSTRRVQCKPIKLLISWHAVLFFSFILASPLVLLNAGGSGGGLTLWTYGVKHGQVHRCFNAFFGWSHWSREVSSVGYSVHWKMCWDVCSSCLQQCHWDELLTPNRFRKLLRPDQKPDQSCARVVRSPLPAYLSTPSVDFPITCISWSLHWVRHRAYDSGARVYDNEF